MSYHPGRKLYYIHNSCPEGFDLYVQEAMLMARRAYEKLSNPADTDFARVFNVIFKTPITDMDRFPAPYLFQLQNGFQSERHWRTTIQHVRSTLRDFGYSWRRTRNRGEADVRIYCDNGRRFVQANGPSGRRWFDQENQLLLTGDLREVSQGQAFTSYEKPPPSRNNRGENPHRVTIDICNEAWEGGRIGVPMSLSDLFESIQNGSASVLNIADIGDTLMTRILFHEFMHCCAYGRDDAPDDNDGFTSGWEYCMRLSKSQACAGAESITFLALIATLSDRRPRGARYGGYTIDRGWDNIPGHRDYPDAPDFDEDEMDSDDEEGRRRIRDANRKRAGNWKWARHYRGNTAMRGRLYYYENCTDTRTSFR